MSVFRRRFRASAADPLWAADVSDRASASWVVWARSRAPERFIASSDARRHRQVKQNHSRGEQAHGPLDGALDQFHGDQARHDADFLETFISSGYNLARGGAALALSK